MDILNDIQNEVATGTMLGNAHITRTGVYYLKQCEEYFDYVKHISEVFQPFTDPKKISTDRTKKPNNIGGKIINLDYWNGEYCYSKRIRSKTHKVFKELRNEWYDENGIKRLPVELKLTPRTIAYWFMDEGRTNTIKREIVFSTQCFTNVEVDRLIYLMKNFNIKCSRQKRKSGPIIYVSSKSFFDFIDMVTPFISLKCFKHKIDISKTSKAREGWCPGKIGMRKAQEIRMLYGTDKYTQKQLAVMYRVSVAIIWRILNDKIYRKINPGFSGSASVHITYKVEACPSRIKTDQFTN